MKNLNITQPKRWSNGHYKSRYYWVLAGLIAVGLAQPSLADNPLVSHVYTADPAARVFGDRVYVVTSHDKDDATSYDLSDYYLFSSDDMINWQDHGIIFDAERDTTWADQAYAPDMIERNGKYYLIFPNSGNSIGILEADQPEGPYTDLIGGPLITRSLPNANVQWLFDPGAFVDDDNTVYIAFGGGAPGNARIARISDDMKSVVGAAVTIDAPDFFEAPYLHKHNGTYYYSYSTTFDNGDPTIDYMTSSSPTSGYTYRGTVLPNPPNNLNNNNHASIIEYQGQSYIFYHNRSVSNAPYRRSINVDLLHYNSDGSIQRVTPTSEGVPKVKNFDPFRRVEAETMDTQSGIATEPASEGTQNVMFDSGDWLKVSNVDFASGASFVEARVAASTSATLDLILDDLNNEPIATVQIPATGGLQNWQTVRTALQDVAGLHDLFFRANGRVNFNWYQFFDEPEDCGTVEGIPICCDMAADEDRDGWGTQWGQACRVTEATNNYAPLNPAEVVVAIDVGGSGDYFQGVYYQPDVYFSGGERHATDDAVLDSGDSALFNSERFGDFAYSIPMENGAYTIDLHFTEIYWEESGQRSFDLVIEGQAVINALDLFQEVGHDAAYTRSFAASVTDGSLDIEVSSILDNGTLSGFVVRHVADGSTSSSSSSSSSTSSSTSSSSSGSNGSGGSISLMALLSGLLLLAYRQAASQRRR